MDNNNNGENNLTLAFLLFGWATMNKNCSADLSEYYRHYTTPV